MSSSGRLDYKGLDGVSHVTKRRWGICSGDFPKWSHGFILQVGLKVLNQYLLITSVPISVRHASTSPYRTPSSSREISPRSFSSSALTLWPRLTQTLPGDSNKHLWRARRTPGTHVNTHLLDVILYSYTLFLLILSLTVYWLCCSSKHHVSSGC